MFVRLIRRGENRVTTASGVKGEMADVRAFASSSTVT